VITVDGNTVSVTTGLACWYDASVGITQDADAAVRRHDRYGNGHTAVYRCRKFVEHSPNELFAKSAVHFIGEAFFDVAGKFFVKEQSVVVRSPSPVWSGSGAILGRKSGNDSGYMFASGLTTFSDQLPIAVSKDETVLSSPFNLASITNYMILN
jgi:hypothetical protein